MQVVGHKTRRVIDIHSSEAVMEVTSAIRARWAAEKGGGALIAKRDKIG